MRQSAALVTSILLTGFGGLILTPESLAEVYRWTDENGRVHFGDKPPRNRPAENITQQSQAVNVDSSRAEREKLNELFAPETPEEKRVREEREAQLIAEQEERQRRCDQAREELRIYEEERFYWIDENGEARNASEQDRQQAIEQLSAAIRQHCE